jgi:hypothetical protein
MSCDADTCVYRNKGSLHTLLGIYVDDGIIASTKPNFIEDILIYLESNFKVVRGEMDYFVGFQIERDHCNGSIFIHQTRYIDDIIKRFGLENAHSITTPVDPHTKLSNRVDAADSYVIVPYKEAVGCAMYATLLTRPDICYATSLVAKFQPKPKQSHWTATKRIYRYLKGTRTRGILFPGHNPSLTLIGYSDADFGGDLDDRRSRTGYVYILGEATIAWGSHRQGATADSTQRAELIACAEAINWTDWLIKLLLDLDITQNLPITIYCDNQPAIALIKNRNYHNTGKHSDLKYYFIREARDSGLLEFQYIHTSDQLADIFTKGLPRDTHHNFCTRLGMTTISDERVGVSSQ